MLKGKKKIILTHRPLLYGGTSQHTHCPRFSPQLAGCTPVILGALPHSLDSILWNSPDAFLSTPHTGILEDLQSLHGCGGHRSPSAGQRARALLLWGCRAPRLSREIVLAPPHIPGWLHHTMFPPAPCLENVIGIPHEESSKAPEYVWGLESGHCGPCTPSQWCDLGQWGFSSPGSG